MPSAWWSWADGTVTGPGAGTVPGAGRGNAVPLAVWNVTLPSTLLITWWTWPFRTVTAAKRFIMLSASVASSVDQPHWGYMANSGTWANTTIGVSLDRPARSLRIQSSWSVPRWPMPFVATALTRARKWTPFTSKL